ncbi:MAG: cadherin-like beta sandwich domain-containing protein, partial [Acidobacteriota bacterium]|nr:cadherin-like beta sandwich domain-containing protein [Acidobacteriota bacterium]
MTWGLASHTYFPGTLFFEVNPLPAASVYRQWTLHIGDDQQSLAGASPVGGLNRFDFSDFYSASSGRTARTVTVRLTAGAAADTSLSALTLAEADGTAVDLDPVFAAGTTAYTASVDNDVGTVTVSGTATDTSATVAFTPADADSTTLGHQVSLNEGEEKTITATVTNGTATQDYTITVTRAASELTLTAPADMQFTATRAISVDPLPEATGATVGTVTYALAPQGGGNLPAWLSFDGTSTSRTMSGTPPAAAAAATLVYTATDDNGTSADTTDDVTTDPVTFTYTVNAAPSLTAPADQTWTAGTAVDFDLTAATGGTAPFTYKLEGPSEAAPPAWMEFDADATPPNVSGTPPAAAAAVTYTYTATDANGAEATAEFEATVQAAAPTGPFSWSATLTVAQGSAWFGYCDNPCPITRFGGPGSHGSLTDGDDAVFAVPGTGNVEVTALDRYGSTTGTGNQLILGLSGLPAPTDYGSWTVTWGDRTPVALSTRSRVRGDGTLEFDTFFTGASAVSEGQEVYVCVASAGAECVLPDRTLSALSLAEADGTAVTLTPTFASDTTAYTATVGSDVETVTLSATANDSGATVEFDPSDADTSTADHQVSLPEGEEKTITVTVTNLGITQDYTITVTREDVPSEVIWSARLTVGAGTVEDGYDTGRTPNYGSLSDTEFRVPDTTVDTTVASLTWFRSGSLTLRQFPETGSDWQNWTLHIGDQQFALGDHVGPAGGGWAPDFRFPDSATPPAAGEKVDVCLTRGGAACVVSPDTTLSALGLTAGGSAVTLDPAFDADIGVYTAEIAAEVATVTVSGTANAAGATVAFTPADADSTTAGHQVSLTAGEEKTITATVTNSGVSEPYTITVTRPEPMVVIWSATLTVAATTDGFFGYDSLVSGKGTLTPDTFTPPGGTETTVQLLDWIPSTGQIGLNFDQALPEGHDSWTLHIGDDQDSLGDLTVESATSFSARGFFSGSAPGAGARVPVCLTSGGATCVVTPDTSLSTLTLVEADSTAVTLSPTFNADIGVYTVNV